MLMCFFCIGVDFEEVVHWDDILGLIYKIYFLVMLFTWALFILVICGEMFFITAACGLFYQL